MPKHRKLYLTFDEEKRKDYLTGFHRRKQQRREKAKLESEAQMKEEIRNVKHAYHNEFVERLRNVPLPNFIADDLKVVTNTTTTDTGQHTVTVEEISIADSHYFLGNKQQNVEEDGQVVKSTPSINPKVSLKKALKLNPKKSSFKKKKRISRALNQNRSAFHMSKKQKHKT